MNKNALALLLLLFAGLAAASDQPKGDYQDFYSQLFSKKAIEECGETTISFQEISKGCQYTKDEYTCSKNELGSWDQLGLHQFYIHKEYCNGGFQAVGATREERMCYEQENSRLIEIYSHTCTDHGHPKCRFHRRCNTVVSCHHPGYVNYRYCRHPLNGINESAVANVFGQIGGVEPDDVLKRTLAEHAEIHQKLPKKLSSYWYDMLTNYILSGTPISIIDPSSGQMFTGIQLIPEHKTIIVVKLTARLNEMISLDDFDDLMIGNALNYRYIESVLLELFELGG